MKIKSILATLFTALTLAHTSAEELNYDTGVNLKTSASLKLSSPMQELPIWGFYPVIATARNDGNATQIWQIETVASSSRNSWNSNSDTSVKSNMSIICPPGETKTYELLVPVARPLDNSSSFSYSSTGHKNDLRSSLSFSIKNSNNTSQTSVDSSILFDKPHTLISQKVTQNLSPKHRSNTLKNYSGLFTPSLLNNNIETLRGFDGLILTLTEWKSLNKNVRSTLLNWTAQGGILTLCSYNASLQPQDLGYSGEVSKFENKVKHMTNYKVQNGEIHFHHTNGKFKERSLVNLIIKGTNSRLKQLNSDFATKSNWPLHHRFPDKDFGILLIITILVIFAIIVGPINFFVFAKQGKRHRLFFTTSAISVITSLILLITIFTKDGIGGEGVQLVHKEIDSFNKKAFVQQEQFCRTGMLLNTSFESSETFSLIQVPIQNSRWARVTNSYDSPSTSYNIQQKEGGILCSGDYFKSRSEHAHFIQAEQSTQENFSIQKKDQGYSVISTFAAEIDELYFYDGEKKWVAKNLTTGSEVTATEISDTAYSSWITKQQNLCSKHLKKQIKTLSSRKNSFLAVTNKAAGISTHSSIDWKTTTLLTGVISLN